MHKSQVVFSAKNLSKVYNMGEVQVFALRCIDLELYQVTIMTFKAKSTEEIMLDRGPSEGDTIVNFPGDLVHNGVRVK